MSVLISGVRYIESAAHLDFSSRKAMTWNL